MKKLAKYDIIEELGRGGFAVVYKARDTVLGRIVALKVLHTHVAKNHVFVQRFQQEARTAARFDHSHIVTIHDVGEEDGQYYIAMNYLPGRGLDERLAEAEGPLPLEQVVSIVAQVADALDYIHRRGSVHRDVKPSNVMVSDEGLATLLDFGIVRAADGTPLTTVGEKMGTPQYMSPEQAEGREIDHRSDVYSLGVMTYQMCTGKAPFDDVSPLVVLRLHADKAPPSPRELNPDLPASVAQVLLKALAKQPDERYQSAGGFAQALQEARQQETQLAEIYAQLQAAVGDENWAAAEAHCQEILALSPDYRDVPALLDQAHQAQAEKEKRLARLYEQARTALRRERWKEVQERCDGIESLAGADYRDVPDLRRRAETGLKRAQAKRERQVRLAQLYERLQAADAEEDWPEVLALAGQMEALDGGDYRDVPNLKEKAGRKLRRQQQSVPGWVWPVGGVAVLGFLIGFICLAFGSGAVPMPTVPISESASGSPPADAFLHDTWTRPADGMVMVYVPGSTFEMGSTEGDDDERSVHDVTLDGFWLNQTEVTNAQFAAFLNDKGNQKDGGAPLLHIGGVSWLDIEDEDCLIEQIGGEFRPKSGYADHPVVEVSWYGANAYCEWVGARLPTEAEWEYAARGPEGNIYPWGNEDPTCDLAQYSDCSGQTVPVGSFPDGASWCDALDMAGNVWEWVADWYDEDYYDRSPSENPTGPTSGDLRVLRGGSWISDPDDVRGANRNWYGPDGTNNYNGFRCARGSD
jgi:formylglycine-generating enzyme required for sulfatase activity/tRNA A-37 threonylcarbamoyl transferase component Bud32